MTYMPCVSWLGCDSWL